MTGRQSADGRAVLAKCAIGSRPAIRRAALLAMLIPCCSWGHGGLSMEKDMCKLRIGPHEMHFTGYQPDRTDTTEFCEDIPAVGATVVVLDFVNRELRDLPTEVRIIRDTGDESRLAEVTVLHLPARTYPTGTIHFDYTFPASGKFVGLVTVGPPGQQYVSRFPFSVGRPYTRYITVAIVAALTAAAAALYYFLVFARRRRQLPSRVA